MKNYFTVVLFLFLIVIATARFSSATEIDEHRFHSWLIEFNTEAEQIGITKKTLYSFIQQAEFLPKVIELDGKQPDKLISFSKYLRNVLPASKVKTAKARYRENKKLLYEIGENYGVQPKFILALWAEESDFGRNMGSFNVVNSLATLAFEGRRADFFKSELIDALKIIDSGEAKQSQMKGSWAGAMGQTQFMPSSFLKYAVDYDDDGKKDLWNSKSDVFASIANYLSQSGWDKNSTWGREVKLPMSFDKKLIDKTIEKSISEWKELGIKNIDGQPLPNKKGLVASVVTVGNDNNSRAFLIYPNYKILLKWNRSLYFASSIGILADKVR